MLSAETVLVRQFPCLSDNYGVLIHDPASRTTIAIDVPDAALYEKALHENGWTLTHILVTHHHWDHTQGIDELKSLTGAVVIGPDMSRDKIEAMTHGIEDGDKVLCGPIEAIAIGTPGHTLDQISWYFPQLKVAHTGDTLFALGCGRVFEGDKKMMWSSLQKLKRILPDDTTIYCGHEYTLATAAFALIIDPENPDLRARSVVIEALRSDNMPTLPTTMKLEKATNPFLRADQPAIKANLGMSDRSDADVFAEIRTRKDNA